jgi:2-polyprenyl-6-hydroxyphenyl methylase/3-demethylubiquinone-9 3-methyltransferase
MIDVGSGAGLVAEPMSRLGAEVVGIDASARNVEIARRHAQATGAPVRYVHTLPESFGEAGSFDVVISLEVVEHVADRAAFLAATARFVAPDGLLVLGTLNRTVRSFLKAIVGAEYMLGWLPRGTHDWRNFVTPAELRAALAPFGLAEAERCGVVYDPIRRRWRIGQDDSATYLQTFARRVS